MHNKFLKMVKAVAVITISDTCFKDHSQDTSGPTLANLARKIYPEANIHTLIIPDEKELIERELKYYCDSNVELVLTTGGTGLAHRDVTPEATKAIIQKEVPALTAAITLESLKKTPMAMLSRSVAGIRDKTLIINFPGSKKAVLECFEVVRPVLSHAIALLQNDQSEVRTIHDSMQFGNTCPHHSNVDTTKVALRARESPFPMLEMSEAWKLVDTIMAQWPEHFEIVSLEDGLGRVVAQRICAMEPMPPFDASVKDGMLFPF